MTTDNTDNLEVGDGERPLLVADLVGLPALWPHGLEERGQVSNGEENVAGEDCQRRKTKVMCSGSFWGECGGQDIPLQTESRTGEDGVPEVPADGGQRIRLDHGSEGGQLLLGLRIVDLVDEGDALHDGQIGPVDALGRVAVIGLEEVGEDGLLIVGVVLVGVGGRVVARLGAVGDGDDARIGGVMVPVVVKKVGHLVDAASRRGRDSGGGCSRRWTTGRVEEHCLEGRREERMRGGRRPVEIYGWELGMRCRLGRG